MNIPDTILGKRIGFKQKEQNSKALKEFKEYCKSARVVVNEKKLSISSGTMKQEGVFVVSTIVFMLTYEWSKLFSY